MTLAMRIESSPQPNRRVLFAVELLDPITHAIMHKGIVVEAVGLTRKPIVSWSGKFVWLEEGSAWPTEISVRPGPGTPYRPHVQPAPPPPNADGLPPSGERLVRITLRPTAAYGFDGTTLLRGRLLGAPHDARPVAGALVQLAWREAAADPSRWNPSPHVADLPDESIPVDDARTDAQGDFMVMMRINPDQGVRPDIVNGLVMARFQVTRFELFTATQVTPPDFAFVPDVVRAEMPPADLAALNQQRRGRIPVGQELPRVFSVFWNELLPI